MMQSIVSTVTVEIQWIEDVPGREGEGGKVDVIEEGGREGGYDRWTGGERKRGEGGRKGGKIEC